MVSFVLFMHFFPWKKVYLRFHFPCFFKKKTLLHFLSFTPTMKVGRELFWFVTQHDFCLRGGSSYRIGKRWLSPVVEIFFCPDLLEIRDFTVCEISLALSKKKSIPINSQWQIIFFKVPNHGNVDGWDLFEIL